MDARSTSDWCLVYAKAVNEDGSLFFPERLSHEFLENQKRKLGSYVYSNQYLNEIVPDDAKVFRKEWLRYFSYLPDVKNTYAFIDPAISLDEGADFTAVVVVDTDREGQWYLKYAKRYKINPTEIVSLCFQIQETFKCQIIGIEDVAYQKALLYMLHEEMKRRNKILPVHGIHPGTQQTKEQRILGLVPRFEWGRILLNQGLHDFEIEYHQFPRGRHDDLLDALSQIEQIATNPLKEKPRNEPLHPSHSGYEKQYIERLIRRSNEEQD